jgi:ATP-dependent helicase HrpB
LHSLSPLPIDELLEPLVQELRSHQAVVLEAPPGAGKTTRVPRALLEAGLAGDGEIWVTEPRRLAARLAAAYVAKELGTELGGRVGYSVRFEERVSAATRLRFVTEGVLLRRLVGKAAPRAPRLIVLDEFHERHSATDLNLMLLRRLLEQDPGLRLVVMSATLEGEAIARYLGGCPRLRSEGRVFPLSIRHAAAADERPLLQRVSSAVKELVQETKQGDVLVFLPGAAEIRQVEAHLSAFAEREQLSVLPLHGEMPLDAQARAIARSERRKIVLATNVAESSITVEGVTGVVDSGLARIAEHSPWTGRQSLEVRPISQASAIQRAGRAGRTQPGLVIRLYTEANFRARPSHDRPEVQRLDLAESLLTLYGAGFVPEAESWLDAPTPASLESATRLLERLGLLEGQQLSALGQRALALPLQPRLARVVLEGQRLGIADRACLAAALLGERDIRLNPTAPARDSALIGCDCDIDQLIELYEQAEAERFAANALRRLSLHQSRVASVRASYQQIRRDLKLAPGRSAGPAELPPQRDTDSQRALSLALLAGFPDRVARRQKPGGRDLILATGHVAQLAEESVARSAHLLIALDAEDRSQAPVSLPRGTKQAARQAIRVRLAAPLEAEWLLDFAAHGITEKEELGWDDQRERVMLTSQLCWGAVVLEQSQRPAPPGTQAAALLERAALAQQANLFGKSDALTELLARAELLGREFPGLGFDAVHALGSRSFLSHACSAATSLAELRELDFRQAFLAALTPLQRAHLERETPEWVQLGGGRRVRVQYTAGQAPSVASRLQDFFGMKAGPRICAGRVALTLHLLAPNRRAVQVTSDLPGFWQRHYPEIRRQLMRRYPRHAWPEDGQSPAQK